MDMKTTTYHIHACRINNDTGFAAGRTVGTGGLSRPQAEMIIEAWAEKISQHTQNVAIRQMDKLYSCVWDGPHYRHVEAHKDWTGPALMYKTVVKTGSMLTLKVKDGYVTETIERLDGEEPTAHEIPGFIREPIDDALNLAECMGYVTPGLGIVVRD
jgi:hypothetical protein